MRVDMYRVIPSAIAFDYIWEGRLIVRLERGLDISTLWSAFAFRVVTVKQRRIDPILLCLSTLAKLYWASS